MTEIILTVQYDEYRLLRIKVIIFYHDIERVRMRQLVLPIHLNDQKNSSHNKRVTRDEPLPKTYLDKLIFLLSQDLDFCDHHHTGNHGSHSFHAFPAKFPPELPRKFIQALTVPGEVVLDPMSGSGTTIVEAVLAGRQGVGFDIDPLALLITQVKVGHYNREEMKQIGNRILLQATNTLLSQKAELEEQLNTRWDKKTQAFINYWFAAETQVELLALMTEIEHIENPTIQAFFELIFSAIIITKSGGVSLALDLAHTRPHRAKVVKSKRGDIVLAEDLHNASPRRKDILTKTLRSPIEEFGKRFQQNIEHILEPTGKELLPHIERGNAQALPLHDASVDLIVTSPPYASNAIDYMRAHKFSLVWLGYTIDELSQRRKRYIGGESMAGIQFEKLPRHVANIVSEVAHANKKKGQAVSRYYSEMTRTLREMFRVLKAGKAAIVVVGNSILSGKDIQIQMCLAEIGKSLGFHVPKIGVRQLDRNRRMMPVGFHVDVNSIIQQRMHEEYVIGFYKPEDSW